MEARRMTIDDFFQQCQMLFFSFPCCVSREKEPDKPEPTYDIAFKLYQLEFIDPFFEFIHYPEDMICPLTKTVMVDPVNIPTSIANLFVTCDKSAALTWITEYNQSPFDRHRISLEDIRENPEMRKKIYLWLDNRFNNLITEDLKVPRHYSLNSD